MLIDIPFYPERNFNHGGFIMKYGIVIFPSKEIQDEANAFRKRYDPQYTNIPPHITLKPTFEMDIPKRDEIVRELKKIANETEPFKIHVTKVKSFAPVTYTIYFKVEPTPELSALNDKMKTGKFPTTKEQHPFVPHITIAQDLVEDEYSDIYASLQMKEIEYEDTIDRFQLCYQLENGFWTVYDTFVFGQE